jgi:hypothetical protein
MPKTAIVYRSPHHGNTKKLLDAIVKAHPEVTLIEAGEAPFDPAGYDAVGFASGVYAGKLHSTVRKVLNAANGRGCKAFVLYTCGDNAGGKYGERYLETIRERGYETCGYFWCVGLDSFGPLKLVGGVNKGRPNGDDMQKAVQFFESLQL